MTAVRSALKGREMRPYPRFGNASRLYQGSTPVNRNSKRDILIGRPFGAPKQTEIEPYISIRKRCSGFYLCKVRKKHKVKCLVLFLLPTQKETLFMEQKS